MSQSGQGRDKTKIKNHSQAKYRAKHQEKVELLKHVVKYVFTGNYMLFENTSMNMRLNNIQNLIAVNFLKIDQNKNNQIQKLIIYIYIYIAVFFKK